MVLGKLLREGVVRGELPLLDEHQVLLIDELLRVHQLLRADALVWLLGDWKSSGRSSAELTVI